MEKICGNFKNVPRFEKFSEQYNVPRLEEFSEQQLFLSYNFKKIVYPSNFTINL